MRHMPTAPAGPKVTRPPPEGPSTLGRIPSAMAEEVQTARGDGTPGPRVARAGWTILDWLSQAEGGTGRYGWPSPVLRLPPLPGLDLTRRGTHDWPARAPARRPRVAPDPPLHLHP